jgi:hypothetical protein
MLNGQGPLALPLLAAQVVVSRKRFYSQHKHGSRKSTGGTARGTGESQRRDPESGETAAGQPQEAQTDAWRRPPGGPATREKRQLPAASPSVKGAVAPFPPSAGQLSLAPNSNSPDARKVGQALPPVNPAMIRRAVDSIGRPHPASFVAETGASRAAPSALQSARLTTGSPWRFPGARNYPARVPRGSSSATSGRADRPECR